MLPLKIVFFCMSFLQALTPLEQIMASQNLDELVRFEKKIEADKTTEQSCKIERARGFFPKNCLNKLDSDMLNIDESQHILQYYAEIQRLCMLQAHNLILISTIESILKLVSVSLECRKALQERRQDLQYIVMARPDSAKTSPPRVDSPRKAPRGTGPAKTTSPPVHP